MNRNIKPMLSAHDLVEKLKTQKGIKFENMSEQEAEDYFLNVNNYLRTASYRKNFSKYECGTNRGKYINLDFACLKDLSSIDFHLREIILKICIDIEHDLKIQLLKDIESHGLDGYSIVDNFLEENYFIINEIASKRTSAYTADLIDKYFVFVRDAAGKRIVDSYDCPIWVLVEILSFGEFIKLYEFYYKSVEGPIDPKLLHSVKSLRNACAHNNCLIYDLHTGNSKASSLIKREISRIEGLSKDSRKKRLSSRFIMEFVTLLYVHKKVTSCKIRTKRAQELLDLFENRMKRHQDYYKDNDLLMSSYKFLYTIIKSWYTGV